MTKIILFLFTCYISTIFGQSPKQYDIQHLQANLYIQPQEAFVQGKLVYRIKILKNTKQIFLDAPGVQVEKVKVGCFKRNFVNGKKQLIIKKKFKKGKFYNIEIAYNVHPHKAMYFVGWHTDGRKQVWTQGQGKDNSHWLPTNNDINDKFTWDLQVDFNKDYQVISNGEAVSVTSVNDSINRYKFKQDLPAPAYLIFLGAGKYSLQKWQTSKGTDLYNFQYPDKLLHDKTYYKSKQIFDALEKEIGVKYPWKNYKQIPIKNFFYGGMENVSATSFNAERYVVDSTAFADNNFVNVSAHELTHQWFGDLVTGKSSYDHWLHEAFATYYARLIDQKIFGKNYNDFEIYKYDQQIIAASNSDTIPLHRPNASSLTYYQKGARIIQMLRHKIGDKSYRKLIKRYLTKFAYKNATTSDFKKLLFEVKGDSLPKFFDLWFETQRIPTYKIIQKKDSILILKNSENIPLTFLLISAKEKVLVTSFKSFKIKNFDKVLSVLPNPDNALLAKIDYQRSRSFVINQVLKSSNFIDQYKAMSDIKKWKFSQKDSIFNKLIHKDLYYPIYQELIAQIKDSLNPKHIQMLKNLFEKDLKTRQQIAIQIDKIPLSLKKDYYSLLNDNSYLTKQMALWHYWQNFSDERKKILDDTQNIMGGNSREFRMMWLTFALVTPDYHQNEKNNYVEELIGYAGDAYNMDVRLTAFETLSSLQIITPKVIDNLIDASFYFNWHLHRSARVLLIKWAENPRFSSLVKQQIDKRSKEEIEFLTKLINK